jgi:hypothetical protein
MYDREQFWEPVLAEMPAPRAATGQPLVSLTV